VLVELGQPQVSLPITGETDRLVAFVIALCTQADHGFVLSQVVVVLPL
jgi:hypothetical protein